MSLDIHKKEIKQYKKLKIIGNLALIKEHIKLFEKKYGLTFHEFEKQVSEEAEDFKKWDDYIEWKAYQKKLNDLNKILDDINNDRVTVN